MKPKFTFLFMLAATFAFVSCSEKDLYEEGASKVYTPADFKMTQTYDVVVDEGTTKQVLVDGELVYDGGMSLTIEIPKIGVFTRATSVVEEIFQGGCDCATIKKTGVLFFEDVTNGDNDYNDLVCHIDEVIELKKNDDKPKYDVTVTPFAMGNRLEIQLGVEILINGEVWKDFLLMGNKELKSVFYGKDVTGFVNTEKGGQSLEGKAFTDKNYEANGTIKKFDSIATRYYIVVEGNTGHKRYACDSEKAELTENNVPFGMFVPGVKTFKYPQEYNSFFDAYPHFMEWVAGTNNDPFKNPNTDLLY